MLSVIGAVGQAEREAMLERQREGIAKAKRDGRHKCRVPTARWQSAKIIKLKAAGIRPSEIASRLGIGRASVYRVLGERSGEVGGVKANAHRVQGLGSSGVPQLLGSRLIDMP